MYVIVNLATRSARVSDVSKNIRSKQKPSEKSLFNHPNNRTPNTSNSSSKIIRTIQHRSYPTASSRSSITWFTQTHPSPKLVRIIEVYPNHPNHHKNHSNRWSEIYPNNRTSIIRTTRRRHPALLPGLFLGHEDAAARLTRSVSGESKFYNPNNPVSPKSPESSGSLKSIRFKNK